VSNPTSQYTSIKYVYCIKATVSSVDKKWTQIQLIQFFLIGIVGCAVQFGPLGTAATNKPTVPPPGHYDDGKIGGITTCRKQKYADKAALVALCPSPDANPGHRGGKPAITA
jgi:hypothetical protein